MSSNTEPTQRWRETWALLGRPAPGDRLPDLVRRYGEPHRHYHTLEHVLDCLGRSADCRELQARPGLVDLALWYHDAVYDPHRRDNEARSAELAAAALATELPASDATAVRELILDTRHDRAPGSADGAVVADLDLAILGATPARFDAYTQAIRREYAFVPSPLYRRRRAKLLRGFLERPWIYATESFRERYEAQARANLARELEAL